MIEQSLRFMEYGLMMLSVIGGCLLLHWLVFRERRVLLLGLALTAVAFGTPSITRHPSFDLVVVREAEGRITVLTRQKFYEGTYETVSGRRIPLEWSKAVGPSATVIVNDSSRLITVASEPPREAPQSVLLAVVFPGEEKILKARVDMTRSEPAPSPERSAELSEGSSLNILSYTASPYAEAVHGRRDDLLHRAAGRDDPPAIRIEPD